MSNSAYSSPASSGAAPGPAPTAPYGATPGDVPRRRGRPPGSRNAPRAGGLGAWFSPGAARARLDEIGRELEKLTDERELLVQVLGHRSTGAGRGSGAGLSSGPSSGANSGIGYSANSGAGYNTGSFPVVRRVGAPRGRRGPGGRPSMLDLLAKIMEADPGRGWTVGQLRDELAKVDAARAGVSNASALISSALLQALRAKTPRFVGSKGSRGHAREYRLANG